MAAVVVRSEKIDRNNVHPDFFLQMTQTFKWSFIWQTGWQLPMEENHLEQTKIDKLIIKSEFQSEIMSVRIAQKIIYR